MALQFNGSTDHADSASAINYSAASKMAIAFWLWIDAYSGVSQYAYSHKDAGTTNRVNMAPDSAGSLWYIERVDTGPLATTGEFTRPSAAAWHHFLINIDITKLSAEIDTIYVDGSSVGITRNTDQNTTGNFPNAILGLMYRREASDLFVAGRLAELAMWSDLLLTGADALALYGNGPLGESSTAILASAVASGSPANYWRMLTDGVASLGGINLTLTGTSQVAHPIATSPGAAVAAGSYSQSIVRPRLRAW